MALGFMNKEELYKKLDWLVVRSSWRSQFLDYHKSEIRSHYNQLNQLNLELSKLDQERQLIEKEINNLPNDGE